MATFSDLLEEFLELREEGPNGPDDYDYHVKVRELRFRMDAMADLDRLRSLEEELSDIRRTLPGVHFNQP